MNVTRNLWIPIIVAGMAMAQNAAPSAVTSARPPAAKGSATTAAPATSGQKAGAGTAAAAVKPVPPAPKPAPKPAVASVKDAKAGKKIAKPPAAADKQSAKKEQSKEKDKEKEAASNKNRRDPFVSVIQTRTALIPNCASGGKKCLIVDQIVLKGVVKSGNGMLAVVENPQRKAYFLREKDPVFNGEVFRITGDSVTFREKVLDKLGKESLRDVVKRISKPA